MMEKIAKKDIRSSPRDILLITGSSGFIGGAIAKHFSNRFQVVGLDRNPPESAPPGSDHVPMDVSSKESIAKSLETVQIKFGENIRAAIHLAAYYSFSGKEDEKYESITVRGTEALLTQLKAKFNLQQFIFSSTMLVHAPTEPGREITERSRIEPTWPYPQSKVEAEQKINEKRGTVPVVNLRIAGVYDDDCHSIPLANHMARIFERQLSSFFFPGEPSHGQAFLHLEDLVSAIEAVIQNRDSLPERVDLLIGEDQPVSYLELQKEFGLKIHGKPWPTIRIPAFMAKIGAFLLERVPFARSPFIKPWMIEHADDHYDLDINRARTFLHWEPKRSLCQTIPKMTQTLLANPEKWYQEHKIKKPLFLALEPVSRPRERTYLALAWANVFLGILLFSNPFMLGYTNPIQFWNDIFSGAWITIVSALTFAPTLRWLRWTNAAMACWLAFSPLAFWSDSSAVYLADTLIGSLVLLASAHTPSRLDETPSEKDFPPGWTYNPSSWSQRLPIMTLAFLGFLFARYLSAFQLGHISSAWDPIFGQGTETILSSQVSKAFPVSDAGLGAYSYLLDVLSATIGDRRRWKTLPWMVILFGLLIIPTGVTSIVLVMLQPIAVGAWCTICLLTAVIMLVMVPPAVDEVAASVQFLAKEKRAGASFWKVFLFGGSKENALEVVAATAAPKGRRRFPVHLAALSLFGTWLFFAPTFFGLAGLAANNLYVVGALIVTFSIIAIAEIARISRFLLVPLGAWLAASTWFMNEMTLTAQWHSTILGLGIAILCLPRGAIAHHFGSLDKWVRWTLFKEGAGSIDDRGERKKAA